MIEFASMDSTHFTKLNKNLPEKKMLCFMSVFRTCGMGGET